MGLDTEYVDYWMDEHDKIKEERDRLAKEVERLKAIVEAPWRCDCCGNYITNQSAVWE